MAERDTNTPSGMNLLSSLIPKNGKECIQFLIVAVVLVAAFIAAERSFYHFLYQDRVWAAKVRKQINYDEARSWALSALALAEYGDSSPTAKFLLTNAPACLLKKNYKRNPDILIGFECVHLIYGGGMYHWGLTIGATNLPSSSARHEPAEKWADGVYFWTN